MDRKYLEEHLSAYLDRQLQPKEMREFERELKNHPDLAAEIARLQKLDAIAHKAEIDLPPDGYFDSLAGRIDARIGRENSSRRFSILWETIAPRSKTIAIISSIAAVLLVVVAVNRIYQPEVIRHIQPTPPMILESKPAEGKRDSQPANAAYGDRKMSIPERRTQPSISDTVLGKVNISPVLTMPAKDEAVNKDMKVEVMQTESQSVKSVQDEKTLFAPMPGLPRSETAKVVTAERKDFRVERFQETTTSASIVSTPAPVVQRAGQIHRRGETGETPEAYEAKIRAQLEMETAPSDGYRAAERSKSSGTPAPALSELKSTAKAVADYSKKATSDSVSAQSMSESGIEEIYATSTKQATVYSLIYARLHIEKYLTQTEATNREHWQARLDTLRALEDEKRREWHDSVSAVGR